MANSRDQNVPNARQMHENLDQLLSICKRAIHDYHNDDSPRFRDEEALIGNLVAYVKVLERTVAQYYYWRPFLAREQGLQKWRRMVQEKDIWGRPREDNPWD